MNLWSVTQIRVAIGQITPMGQTDVGHRQKLPLCDIQFSLDFAKTSVSDDCCCFDLKWVECNWRAVLLLYQSTSSQVHRGPNFQLSSELLILLLLLQLCFLGEAVPDDRREIWPRDKSILYWSFIIHGGIICNLHLSGFCSSTKCWWGKNHTLFDVWIPAIFSCFFFK